MNKEKDYLVDIDEELEEKKLSEKTVKAVRRMGNFYLSQEQVENKGNLLGHFKSGRFLRTYIDVYEKAIVGMAEIITAKRPEEICRGYAYLEKAVVEDGILYLVMNDEKIYRLRYLKEAETIAYLINKQRANGNQGYKV